MQHLSYKATRENRTYRNSSHFKLATLGGIVPPNAKPLISLFGIVEHGLEDGQWPNMRRGDRGEKEDKQARLR